MKNRILNLFHSFIPYLKELMPLAKSVEGCIIMQQLDYRFEKYPHGFYKFISPCENALYKEGDSWCEELGMSVDKFRTNFEKIGVRYKSKKDFDSAEDKFRGMFYCSYTDKRTRKTHWFRNHALLDKALDDLFGSRSHGTVSITEPGTGLVAHEILGASLPDSIAHEGSQTPRDGETPSLGTRKTPSPVDRDSPSPGVEDVSLLEKKKVHLGITETTSIDLQRLQLQKPGGTTPVRRLPKKERSSGEVYEVSGLLHYPPTLSEIERIEIEKQMAECHPRFQQAILDELEGRIRAGTIRTGAVPLCFSLVEASHSGRFHLAAGISVHSAREKGRHIAKIEQERESLISEAANYAEFSEDALNRLSPRLREFIVRNSNGRN